MKMRPPDQKLIFSFLESKKALAACVLVTGVLAVIVASSSGPTEEVKIDASVDTFIPAGFVLVPIDVQNYESLDSILGPHGIVDLYLPSQTGSGKGSRVANRVKIMRAPLNPSQFAVLVREDESNQLVRTESAFFVVVQNSKQIGTGIVERTSEIKKTRVAFSDGGRMRFVVLIIFSLCAVAKAEVVVRHPDTEQTLYLKEVAAGSTTVVDFIESKLPAAADEKRLLQKFEKAQSLFLSSDLTAAKVAFIEITEEAFRADWTETQRKVITISFLRVAQLSDDPHAAENYLVRAVHFGWQVEIDPHMFPPPLVSQFSDILNREKAKSLQVDLKDKFPQHDLIIIDGKRVRPELLRAYTVFPGRHRLTAISNSHQLFTQELTLSQLNLIKADVPAFAIGTCSDPSLSGYQSLGAEEVRIIFPNDCARTYTGTSWVTSTDRLPAKLTQLPPHSFALSSAPKPILTKKKLLIIGIGVGVVVTSALIIKKSQQRREEVQPVTRQGF